MRADTDSILRDSLPNRANPSIELAHFGKHPAWEDHMEHLGAETASILAVKQALYVHGIGELLGRGQWKALQDAGSALPFDHELIWSRGDNTLIGVLSASKDAKGRDLYPLIALCHVRGYPLPSMISPILSETRESLSKLQTTQSRDAAKRLMRGIQGRIRNTPPDATELSKQDRESFLNTDLMGPNRQGYLRILHVALAAAEFGNEARLQMRVPLCHTETPRACLLWRALMQTIFGDNTLVLQLKQRRSEFMDILIGPPRSDDYYCLRAADDAIALTHETPYTISDELRNCSHDIFARFIAGEPPRMAKTKFSQIWKRLFGDRSSKQ
jgi:hypothetical protein